MQRSVLTLVGVVGLGFGGLALADSCGMACCDAKVDPAPMAAATTQPVQYTCSMHSEVVSDKPGKCPKCGMKLVEKKAEKPADAPAAQ